MNNLTQKVVDAWNAKVDDVIKCGKPINTPEMEKYKKENPLPTREELKEIIRKHKS